MLDQARLVPVDDGLRHEIGERLFAALHRQTPWLRQDRFERHFVVAPFRLLQFADDRRVVVRERHAVSVTQRRVSFGGSRESDAFDAVFLLQLLVVERALDQAHLLAFELVPALQFFGFLRHHIRARRVVIGLDDVDRLAALGRVAHRRNHQIDLPLLQELDPVRCDDGRQLELNAETLRDIGGKIGLEADDLPRRIEITKGPVIGLRSDDENTFFLDVVQHVGIHRARTDEREQQRRRDNPFVTHMFLRSKNPASRNGCLRPVRLSRFGPNCARSP